MRYELLLQTGDAAVPFDPSAVDERWAQRPVTLRPDGVRLWRLKEGEVEIRTLIEGGTPIATELRAPLSHRLELIRELVVEAALVAQEAGVKLYDPQLLKTLTAADEGLVAEQFLRTSRYAGEMMGVSEAIGAGFTPPETGMKAGTKVLLGLIGLFVLVYLLTELLLTP